MKVKKVANFCCCKNRVSPSRGTGGTPHYPKNWLVPPLFCPKNNGFVIFMKLLVILPKMSPLLVEPKWETLKNPGAKVSAVKCFSFCCKSIKKLSLHNIIDSSKFSVFWKKPTSYSDTR